jgi:ATP-dependent RNA helicase RhlE
LVSFAELDLCAPIRSALAAEEYSAPTPIQARAIPHILAGRDLLGIAQTGTGKTAAFALPILHRLSAQRQRAPRRGCRALVLSPTRELASQIASSFQSYGRHLRLSVAAVFGGVSQVPQERALAHGVDILVATPGRLQDHLDQRNVRIDEVEVFVLDEADRMLDMGFLPAIKRLIPLLPRERQSLFFSATMPEEIGALAEKLLRDPVRVAVAPAAATADKVEQRVVFCDAARKRDVLAQILRDDSIGRTLVFTRTKRGADRVCKHLVASDIAAAAIHGDKSQGQRERALAGFKSGRCRVLVATDIAARGIDVDGITHVINYELPNVPESYVHRIGRTARAGAAGNAISLCAAEEKEHLREIEKLIKKRLPASDAGGAPRPQAAPAHGDHVRPAHGEHVRRPHPARPPARGDRHARPAPRGDRHARPAARTERPMAHAHGRGPAPAGKRARRRR